MDSNNKSIKGKKIGVIGLGRTGIALLQYLHAQGAVVYAFDEQPKEKLADAIKSLEGIPVTYEIGAAVPEVMYEAKTWIVSPGVPCYKNYLVDARKKDVRTMSEIEFCLPYLEAPIVAITGSNGKSTTTELVGHILKGCGKKVFVGGNLGTPLVTAIGQSYDYIVLEISTFQMELTDSLKPKVACVLNISPNHLDRHGNMTTYQSLKEKLLFHMRKEGVAVLNDDDDICREIRARSQTNVKMVSGKNHVAAHVRVENGEILLGEGRTVSLKGFPLLGQHNIDNAVAAVTICSILDCPKESIEKYLKTFQGLPHRMQVLDEVGGVLYVNDSKSTTPEAAVFALSSVDRPIVYIAGGRSKNFSYREIGKAAKRNVKKAIFFGEAAEMMARDFAGVEVEKTATLEEAVNLALPLLKKGDALIFSPANSSFDQYANFEKRGEHFTSLVGNARKSPKK